MPLEDVDLASFDLLGRLGQEGVRVVVGGRGRRLDGRPAYGVSAPACDECFVVVASL